MSFSAKMKKPTQNLFDEDSDIEPEIKAENEFAKNYDTWRNKEELNKLKTKYGEDVLDASDSSTSDDDEEAEELTEEVEKDFFKTLSCLKKKDPKIYDNSVTFFKHQPQPIKEKNKHKPTFIRDHERQLLLEKGGLSDQDEDEPKIQTYAQEQQSLQESIKKINVGSEDEDDEMGGMLQTRQKTKEEHEKETEFFKYLSGQTEEIDGDDKEELKPLKDFWSDPHLSSQERFLRDYVLKKRYLEKDNDDYVPTLEEVIHDSDDSLSGDEQEIERQEEFEYKYNYRFEEPDQEFIKRYPRTIEQSLRKVDDRRKQKRVEIKERKKLEKEEKLADIKKLQELKRKEIEEKIEKLKEVTGNTEVAFGDEDIDGDFDPDAHDRRMQALFDEEFYQGKEGDQKPEFPEIDAELEIENWDKWNPGPTSEIPTTSNEPHCEDENFIMDADYNPSISLKEELIDNSKGKKKRKRKSKVAEALSRPKPKFDPNDKNYEEYFEEYYKLDCEDIIGDVPCRFKYRQVVPNDFGLSVEEILLAKDKELNRWCSLKKMVQRRPETVEKYEQIAYSKKGQDVKLKQKLIPSLFAEETKEEAEQPSKIKFENEKQDSVNDIKEEENPQLTEEIKNEPSGQKTNIEDTEAKITNNEDKLTGKPKIKASKEGPIKKRKRKQNPQGTVVKIAVNEDKPIRKAKIDASIEKPIKKRKLKQNPGGIVAKKAKIALDEEKPKPATQANEEKQTDVKKRKIRKSKRKTEGKKQEEKAKSQGKKPKRKAEKKIKSKGKKTLEKAKDVKVGLSDARLSAFGINPKKFKNKLKYGNKDKSKGKVDA